MTQTWMLETGEKTGLHIAVGRGDDDMVYLLLAYGADADVFERFD